MPDPTNRAFQERFYNLLLKVDRPTALRLLGWFADAAHGAGCLTAGLHMVEAEPLGEPMVDDLEENIRQIAGRGE